MTDHFQSVNAMIAALRSDDAEERLNSVRGLHVIAATLGPDRVKGELIPFLTDYLDESDDVLREFAKVLATMVPEVGGIQHVSHIVTPLETLCGLEDVTVRDEATTSLALVGEQIFRDGTSQQQQDYVSLITNMAKSTSPQTRYSACFLLRVPYPTVSNGTKAQLRQTFQKLASDEEILVRRGAVVALGDKFAKVLGSDGCSDLLAAFLTCCKDTKDGIKLQCVNTAVALLPFLSEGAVSQVALAYKALAADSSWRVRYMAADKLAEAAKSFSTADVNRVAFDIFKKLLDDQESEIRASAVFHMNELLALLTDATAKKNALSQGAALAADSNAHVRMSVASSILRCAHHVSKDLWTNTITPTCSKLLNDSEADVKLAIVSGFGAIGGSPEGKEIAPKLVPVVMVLANDSKWRVRETVVQQLPSLISNLNKSVIEVLDVCLEALSDRVATIREAACQSCYQLLKLQGMAWGKSTLFPKILPMAQQQPRNELPSDETVSAPHNYLRRVTFLHLLQTLLPLLDNNSLSTTFLPALQQLTADATANVRINVARTLVMAKRDGKAGGTSAKELDALLTKLGSDQDVDVKDEANRQG